MGSWVPKWGDPGYDRETSGTYGSAKKGGIGGGGYQPPVSSNTQQGGGMPAKPAPAPAPPPPAAAPPPPPPTSSYKGPQAPYQPQNKRTNKWSDQLANAGGGMLDPDSDYSKRLLQQVEEQLGKQGAAQKRSAGLSAVRGGMGSGASSELLEAQADISRSTGEAIGNAGDKIWLAAPQIGAGMMGTALGAQGQQSGQNLGAWQTQQNINNSQQGREMENYWRGQDMEQRRREMEQDAYFREMGLMT